MKYKYKKSQIFGKKLPVPKEIESLIFANYLSFQDFIKYGLEDKIPVSCLYMTDRMLVEKFSLEKVKQLDWELLSSIEIDPESAKHKLLKLDPSVEDLNEELYKMVKDKLRPVKYSSKMKERFPNSYMEIKEDDDEKTKELKTSYNEGNLYLDEIIENWEMFKDMDLSYVLKAKKINLTQEELKEFVNKNIVMARLIFRDYDASFIEIVKRYASLSTEEEKDEFIKNLAIEILEKTKHEDYMTLTNEEYKMLFTFYPLEKYLLEYSDDEYATKNFLKQLEGLPEGYLFEMEIPFDVIRHRGVLQFVNEYGLKNVEEFDQESGHLFSRNNGQFLKDANMMYLHYGGSMFATKYTGDGIYTRPYTKEEFYEAVKRMIIHGPTDSHYDDKAPDIGSITGKFREMYQELFLSEDAPDELKTLFYKKELTPKHIAEHPEYVPYIKGKDYSSCFQRRSIRYYDEQGISTYKNIYNFISDNIGHDECMNLIMEYAEILEIVYNRDNYGTDVYPEYKGSPNGDEIRRELDLRFRNVLLDCGVPFPKNIPQHFMESNPDLFLSPDAPDELKEAYYSRTLDVQTILEHPEYIEYLKKVNVEMAFKYLRIRNSVGYPKSFMSKVKEHFGDDAFDFMLLYGKYIEQLAEIIDLTSFNAYEVKDKESFIEFTDKKIYNAIKEGKMSYDDSIPTHFKNSHQSLFLGEDTPEEIRQKYYNREFSYSDFRDNPDLLNYFKNTNIVFGFPTKYLWLLDVFDNDNILENNINYLKIIKSFCEIKDDDLEKRFIDYVMKHRDNLDYEKLALYGKVYSRLSLSNSHEMHAFRVTLADQIMESDDPLRDVIEIERVFVENNIPTIGKIFAAFEILHPEFTGFDFGDESTISPTLKNASTRAKKFIVFSDLIKINLGSNNRTMKAYLNNIETGNRLYEAIMRGEVKYEELSDEDKNELYNFANHLFTLYQKSMKGKLEGKKISKSDNVIETITMMKQILSPDGSMDYDLGDRVVSMFCGYSGIETVSQAKDYMKTKVEEADKRNRESATSKYIPKKGDIIKGIGKIKYLGSMLQRGICAREFLGAEMGSDATPLDTDLSVVEKENPTSFGDAISGTAAHSYGPIYIVLKNNGRFSTTRTHEGMTDEKRDLSRYELFHTGVLGTGHYGIRTGFASTDIDYIVVETYDPRIGIEIAMNGFYIPVVDKSGKLLFSPKDYDELRSKMAGMSYFEQEEYKFSPNLESEDVLAMVGQLKNNEKEVQEKRNQLMKAVKAALDELGLTLKTEIDGELTPGSVELIDTGSTGRGTNKPHDGDFDFMMRVDREIMANDEKLRLLKETIIKHLVSIKEKETIGKFGDWRFKGVDIGNGIVIDLDVTFITKTDKVSYSTDMALKERLAVIRKQDPEKYKLVVANILIAKSVLKDAEAYKPNRGDVPQGGLGGVGVENWILQNGGSFEDAARSFVAVADECYEIARAKYQEDTKQEVIDSAAFDLFVQRYSLWDFGENHLAGNDTYPHDEFVSRNMSASGFAKMYAKLKEYLLKLDKSRNEEEEQKPHI